MRTIQSRAHRTARLPGMSGLLLAAVLVVAACQAAAPIAPGVAPAPADFSGGAAASGASGESGQSGKDLAPIASGDVVSGDGSQMIRTGSLQLQVADVDAAVDAAKTAVTGLGGYVAGSKASGGDQPVAVITYRIPANRWDDGLTAVKKLAIKVVGESTDSSDVSAQLVDIDARLKNLRAAETALQGIAANATKVSDVLEVQSQLTQVRGQIESLAAQQQALQNRVQYATLTVTFGLQVAAVTQASRQWDPAREVDNASASLVGLLQAIATAGIWFVIVWLPGLLLLAVVVVIIAFAARRLGIGLPRLGGGPRGGAVAGPSAADETGAASV